MHGVVVVLPGIFFSLGGCVLDHPLPPPEGGELRGGPSFCRGLTHGAAVAFWTSPCPLLKEGAGGGGTELFVGRPLLSRKSDSPSPLRIPLKPSSSPTHSRLPRGKSRPRPNSPPSGGVPEGRGGRTPRGSAASFSPPTSPPSLQGPPPLSAR